MKLNQKGFGVIEGILIVVILTAIVAAGYYAYLAHHKAATPAAVPTASDLPMTATTPAQDKGFLTIQQWGVRGPIAEEISYSLSADGKKVDLHSAQVAALYSGCETPNNVGDMMRLSQGDKYGTMDQPIESFSNEVTTKIGSYYYVYESGQQACLQGEPYSTANETTYNKVISDLKNFHAKLQAN